MSEILIHHHGDDTRLAYYHGAVLDVDVNNTLTQEGDYLLQSKHVEGKSRTVLYLAVRWATTIRRLEVRKSGSHGEVRVLERNYPNVRKMCERHAKEPLLVGQEAIYLKRAIPKGRFQLHHDDVKMIKMVGSGAYGTVYKGMLLKDNRIIAAKRIDPEGNVFNEVALKEMMKEARVMQLYDHCNIVRFYGFLVDRQPYLLIMEFCDGGAVEDKLRSKGRSISIAQRIDWCAQGAAGLEYLHYKECIHRDIASRNCLLDRKVIKLADFGMCRATSVYKVDLDKPTNVRWLAPEVWKTAETRPSTDIYAFGVLIWELFEQPYRTPYEDWKPSKVKTMVMGGFRMRPGDQMPAEMVKIMEAAWNQDPARRPITSELKRQLQEVAVSRPISQMSIVKSAVRSAIGEPPTGRRKKRTI